MTDLRKAAEQALAQPQTRVGEMEWQWGYERGWDAAMNQKHEWVGLTDEERRQIVLDDPFDWVAAVEAKLKEKNT